MPNLILGSSVKQKMKGQSVTSTKLEVQAQLVIKHAPNLTVRPWAH